jgi:hypothetical protein
MISEETKLLIEYQKATWNTDVLTKTQSLSLAEAIGRLSRISILLDRIRKTQESLSLNKNGDVNYLILDAENFYYQSFRVIRCLEILPGFSNNLRRKFPGITLVRNILMEHSEDLSLSYSWNNDGTSLSIKPQKKEAIDDNGLEENIQELKNSLNKTTQLAIDRLIEDNRDPQ